MPVNRLIAVLTLLFAAAYFYAAMQIPSYGDPLGPQAFPMLLGAVLGLTGFVMLIGSFRAVAAGGDAPSVTAPSAGRLKLLATVCAVVAWTFVYFLAFTKVGYLIATAIYLFALLIAFNRGKWITNVAVAVLFPICSYLVFVKLLYVSLPEGLFGF